MNASWKVAVQEALTAGSHYDALVKNPALLPKPLSTRYVKELKARIGRGTQVKVIKSESTWTRGWDYGNYTVLEITPPKATEGIKAAIVLHVAEGEEVSGNVSLDSPYGTFTVPRTADPDKYIQMLMSELSDLLRPKKTARHYVRMAALKLATVNDDETLLGLLEMEIENMDGDRSEADLSPGIKSAAKAYDSAVEKTLHDWVSKNMDALNFESGPFRVGARNADEVVEVMMGLRGGAGYLYFMEAEGHGVGTWDGDWDVLFKDHAKTIKELSALVKQKTRAQYQKLKSALEDRASELVPEPEEE